MNTIQERLEAIIERIDAATRRSGRDPGSVRLVAVSKTVGVGQVEAALNAGVRILGENYVQEAREKYDRLGHRTVQWHFIGHLQSNKAKYAVRMFDLIHSVDSFKLARELDKRARRLGKIQNILIQVNVAEEATKSGVSVSATIELIQNIRTLSNVAVKGLMTMPPYFNAPERVRPFFRRLLHMREDVQSASIPGVSLSELSMGMTGDFEVAIEEGATLVRIGTAIFGERD